MKQKTIGDAVEQYLKTNKNATLKEVQAFIDGWTAKEVQLDIEKISNLQTYPYKENI